MKRGIIGGALAVLAAAGPAAAENAAIRMGVVSNEIAAFCVNTGGVHSADLTPYPPSSGKVELTNVLLSVSQSPVAVSQGDVDMGECAGVAVVAQAWKKGARNVVIVLDGSTKPSYVLMGGPKITTIAALKGGVLGTPGPQSTAAEAVEVILQRAGGLMPERDYTLVSTGTGASRMAALMAGKIDGISTYPPLNYRMVDDGFHQLADEVSFVPRYASGTMLVNRDWAKGHGDAVVALLKTFVQAGLWLKDPANKDKVIASLAKTVMVGASGMGDDYARRYYQDIIAGDRVAFDGYADAATYTASLDLMASLGFLDKADYPPLGEMVDYTYLNRALKELGRPPVPLLK